MKMLKITKQNEPDIDELNRMLSDLKDFLDEEVNINDDIWNQNFQAVIDFQDPDGSFNLLNFPDMPSDARVDFFYMPTYVCTAILMKAFMADSSVFDSREKSALSNGLKMSCDRNLSGHGLNGFKCQIEALNIFMKGHVREFLDLYTDFCPEFNKMINKIISSFRDMESQGDLLESSEESYETKIKAINEYFSNRNVFVYGTLMKGEGNNRYLQNSTFLCTAAITGYQMYDVGWYPAIVPGDNLITGELYMVPIEDMPAIDMLEGEGTLYIKKCERSNIKGKSTFAFVYVYNGDVSKLKKISSWRDYVWYASYGSNMLNEGLMRYIEGGSIEGSRYRKPCKDTSPPVAIRTVEIPYDMYFGNYSGSWNGSGVSFLDTSKKGKALGVAYLITKEQFDHIAAEENSGRYPDGTGEWYEDIIDLGEMEGFELKTVTNKILRPYNRPHNRYWFVLFDGIKENWQDMSDEEIREYLNSCIR